MPRVFDHRGRWLRTTLGILAAGLAAVLPAGPLGAAGPPYQLYYAFDVPLALQGFVLSDSGTQTTYSGTLKGALGGLPVRAATFTYGTGASKTAGGGTFSLATAAGTIRNGQIFMTTDGKHTTLLFFGLYLGTRIEFTIIADSPQIGGLGVTASGLAPTGFRSHEEYMAALQSAAAALPAGDRERLISQGDANPRLVSEYQQKPIPR